jgi:hypothetical protein
MQQGTASKREVIAMTRRSITAVLGALLVALFITVQSAAASIAPSVDGSSFGYRFLEENTSTLPSGIVANVAPSLFTADQQRFIEQNTSTLPSVSDALAANAAPALTMAQWKFIEVNTMLPSAGAQTCMEDATPKPGHPY